MNIEMAELSIGTPYFVWDGAYNRWRLYFPYTASGMNASNKYYILPGIIEDQELKPKGSWGLPYKGSWSADGYVVWDKVDDLDILYFLLWNRTVGGWDPFYTNNPAAEALTSKSISGLTAPTSPCEAACEVSCQTGCEISCEAACEVSCQTGCEISCEAACEATCEVSCQATIEVLGCPIAVVANGTELVDALGPVREFRDIVLKKHATGQRLVELYYGQITEWLSPFLAKHDLLKRGGRMSIRVLLWVLGRKKAEK